MNIINSLQKAEGPPYLGLLAQYNADMNRQLYDAAACLSAAELTADRGAFFGSLAGTLNHLLAGDTIWLGRFAAFRTGYSALAPVRAMPQPDGLAHVFSSDLATLRAQREQLDALISNWTPQVSSEDLGAIFEYRSTNGTVHRKHFGSVLTHFFNHQTHHRGQASTLLTQAGADIGITDLVAWVPAIASKT
ncbi:MAG: DinB family protein [Duganella sp.]